jgi:hypothetical protein
MAKTLKQILTKSVLSVNDLAKKHNVSVDMISKQLAMGIAVEK